MLTVNPRHNIHMVLFGSLDLINTYSAASYLKHSSSPSFVIVFLKCSFPCSYLEIILLFLQRRTEISCPRPPQRFSPYNHSTLSLCLSRSHRVLVAKQGACG